MLKHKKKNAKNIWVCSYCKYESRGCVNLKIHIDKKHLHHGLKQFSCNKCEKTFIFEETLNNHKKTKHSECFICKICDKQTSCKKALEIHMDSHHGEKNEAMTDKGSLI